VKGFKTTIAALVLCTNLTGFSVAATSADEGDLLRARELVWRA